MPVTWRNLWTMVQRLCRLKPSLQDVKTLLTWYTGKGSSGQNYVPWHAKHKTPAGTSRRASSVEKGDYEPHGLTCMALSDSPEVGHGAHTEFVLISAGELDALRLMFAMMAASLLYRGAADLYRSVFGIGYGPFRDNLYSQTKIRLLKVPNALPSSSLSLFSFLHWFTRPAISA